MAINLNRNPNGTIARRSDGKLMRAPTQAEFEDCCCDDYDYCYKLTPCDLDNTGDRCNGGDSLWSKSSALAPYVGKTIEYEPSGGVVSCWLVSIAMPSGEVDLVQIASGEITRSYDTCYICCCDCFWEPVSFTYTVLTVPVLYDDVPCVGPWSDWHTPIDYNTTMEMHPMWDANNIDNYGIWEGQGYTYSGLSVAPGSFEIVSSWVDKYKKRQMRYMYSSTYGRCVWMERESICDATFSNCENWSDWTTVGYIPGGYRPWLDENWEAFDYGCSGMNQRYIGCGGDDDLNMDSWFYIAHKMTFEIASNPLP